MAAKLYNLRDVPGDEADELRQLLKDNHFDYYETPAGSWGISAACLWLYDESELARAKGLIKTYQVERSCRMRAEYERLKAEGRATTTWGLVQQQPLKVVVYVALIIFFAYISIGPFVNLSAQ